MPFTQKLEEVRKKLTLVGYDANDTLDAFSAVNKQLSESYALAGKVRKCNDCSLRANCKVPVPGMGDTHSPVMIVGESPSDVDMEIQAPFVGPSGQLLTIFLNKLGIDRRDVYITNIIKCGGKKELSYSEAQQCMHHYFNELAIIQPRVIIALGNAPLKVIREDSSLKIGQERGQWFQDPYLGADVMPTYNPAFLFHLEGQEQIKAKNQMWNDMKTAFKRAQII
jgi:uracil-DNA glycosylase